MCRLFALGAEIVRCTDDAAPEELLPHAIDHDARRQRDSRVRDNQRANASRSSTVADVSTAGTPGRDLCAFAAIVAAERDVGLAAAFVSTATVMACVSGVKLASSFASFSRSSFSFVVQRLVFRYIRARDCAGSRSS